MDPNLERQENQNTFYRFKFIITYPILHIISSFLNILFKKAQPTKTLAEANPCVSPIKELFLVFPMLIRLNHAILPKLIPALKHAD